MYLSWAVFVVFSVFLSNGFVKNVLRQGASFPDPHFVAPGPVKMFLKLYLFLPILRLADCDL